MLNGSLQRKNGNYYAVLYIYNNGKRKPKWISLNLPVKGTSKRKAQEAFEDMRRLYEDTLNEDKQPASDIPFYEYLETWLVSVKSTIAEATYRSYTQIIHARIKGYFEPLGLTLNEVTPRHIEQFYRAVLDAGCNANTVIHYHAVIRKALQSAVRKELIARNPADLVEKPRKNTYKGTFYTPEEIFALFDVLEGHPLEICVKLAAFYGLRRSEVLGLKWDAVDFKNKTISIRHKIIEVRENGVTKLVGEDMLKNKSSFRTFPLLPGIEELLLCHSAKCASNRALLGSGYYAEYNEYICVLPDGKLLSPTYVSTHFAQVIRQNDMKHIRFHDLRHTCASLLLQNGISMKQIQLWMGHSNFSTTADIYAHLDSSAQRESALAIEKIFTPSNAQEGVKSESVEKV